MGSTVPAGQVCCDYTARRFVLGSGRFPSRQRLIQTSWLGFVLIAFETDPSILQGCTIPLSAIFVWSWLNSGRTPYSWSTKCKVFENPSQLHILRELFSVRGEKKNLTASVPTFEAHHRITRHLTTFPLTRTSSFRMENTIVVLFHINCSYSM